MKMTRRLHLSAECANPLPNKFAVWIQTRPANIFRQRQQDQRKLARAVRKAALLPLVFVMYAYATGGAVWARRHGDYERAGADAAVSLVHSVFSGASRCRWWLRS